MEVASFTSALGLAENVYQFVEFASKLCHMFLEIQSTANGMTLPNADSKKRIKIFLSSIERFNTDLRAYSPVLSGRSGTVQLEAIVRRCKQIAGNLLSKLASLQVKGEKTIWKAVVTTVKSLWEEGEIRKLQDELHKFREELLWIVMLSMRSDVSLLKTWQKYQFKATQDVATLTGLIWSRAKDLPGFPISQTMQPSGHFQNTNLIPNNAEWHLAPQTSNWHQKAAFDASMAMAQTISLKFAEIDHKILESLAFMSMRDRDYKITNIPPTHNWIFHNSTTNTMPSSNFSSWLAAENSPSIYWINGKVGSGKSTLIKHLFCHNETRIILKRWASQSKLVLARFFFDSKGKDLQKSPEGLLRTLLHECLRYHRELMPLVVPYYNQFGRDESQNHWSLDRLQIAFQRLVSQTKVALKFCFFVDGLDEYAGNLSEITSMLIAVAKHNHVKICTSSRPHPIIQESLVGFPGLVLQNFTGLAIQRFVRSNLNHNKAALLLERQNPGWIDSQVRRITSEASGVFLWAEEIVGSLLVGLSNYDGTSDLWRRFSYLPPKLEKLYEYMIQRVQPQHYLEEGFRLLLLVKIAGGSVNVLSLYFAAEMKAYPAITNEPLSMIPIRSEQEERCMRLIKRTQICCSGLLVASGATGEVLSTRVEFLHNSVSNFLETEFVKREIRQKLGVNNFIPEVQILRGMLWRLKTYQTRQRQCANIERSDFFRFVCHHVNEFMKMALKAESVTRYHQTGIVDELNRVTSALWSSVSVKSRLEQLGLIHWTVAPRNAGAFRQTGFPDAQLSWISALGEIRRTKRINHNTVMTNDTMRPGQVGNEVDIRAFAYYAKERGLHLYAAAKGLPGN